jgi:hypothetical protein
MMKRQLHLNLFIHGRGHHEASWRHSGSSPLPLTDIRYHCCPVNLGSPARNGMILNGVLSI